MKFSTLQAAILLALARYGFLTHSQCVLLRLGTLGAIRKATLALTRMQPRNPLVDVLRFAPERRIGRREHVFSLTNRGRSVAVELGAKPKVNRYLSIYDADIPHRKETINFHIRLDQCLAKQNRFGTPEFATYFEKKRADQEGEHRKWFHAATRLRLGNGITFIPDSILVIKARDAEQRAVFLVECVLTSKKQRVLRQIHTHLQGLRQRVLARQFGLPSGQGSVSLFLFKDAGFMGRVIEELNRDHALEYGPYQSFFLFATIAQTAKNVRLAWQRFDDPRTGVDFLTGKPCSRPP